MPPVETKPQQAEQATPAGATPKTALLEAVGLVLLSLATVGTAWCSYQAAAWGGAAGGTMNQSIACSRRAATKQLQADQRALLDVMLFSAYMDAYANSNQTLARFYAQRFRDEARTAFDAWMATRPFENPDAKPHPFVSDYYHPRLLDEVQSEEAEAERLSAKAGEVGRVSRNYVLITVLLACALFCGGTASKFDTPWIRRTVLVFGLGAFVFAAARLFLLPVQV
jgi:hypothetical protein